MNHKKGIEGVLSFLSELFAAGLVIASFFGLFLLLDYLGFVKSIILGFSVLLVIVYVFEAIEE